MWQLVLQSSIFQILTNLTPEADNRTKTFLKNITFGNTDVRRFLVTVAYENSVCVLGDCNPPEYEYSSTSVNVPATCGDFCAADQPKCIAWVTATFSGDHCHRYSVCPTLPLPLDSLEYQNKRIYTCFPGECLRSVNNRN